MAKKRSKKDRIRAKLRHAPAAKVTVAESNFQKVELKKETVKIDYLKEIFAYDPKLILKDLRKTLLIVLFVLIILLTIFLLYT